MRIHFLVPALMALTLAACAPSASTNGSLLDRNAFGDFYRVRDSVLVPNLSYPPSTFAVRQSRELDGYISAVYRKSAPVRCAAFEHVFWNDTLDYRARMNDVEHSLKTLGYAVSKVGEREGVAWGLFVRPGATYTYRWEFGDNLTFLSFCRTERNPNAPADEDEDDIFASR